MNHSFNCTTINLRRFETCKNIIAIDLAFNQIEIKIMKYKTIT